MYHKYLQVFDYAGNRENHVNLVNRSRHLKDDITVFTPVGIYSNYVARVFFSLLPISIILFVI